MIKIRKKVFILFLFLVVILGLIVLLSKTYFNKVVERRILEDLEVKWDLISYHKGGYKIIAKGNNGTKKRAISPPYYILDAMLGKKNELLITNGKRLENFIYTKYGEIDHSVIFSFDSSFFVKAIIGRVSDMLWVFGEKTEAKKESPQDYHNQYYIICIKGNQISKLINISEIIGYDATQPYLHTGWERDVVKDIPYFTIHNGKTYLLYYETCNDKWEAHQIPISVDPNPFIVYDNKLICLKHRDISFDLKCPTKPSLVNYSNRNYFVQIGNDCFIYLDYLREYPFSKIVLKCYNAKTGKEDILKVIPSFAWQIVKKDNDRFILRPFRWAIGKEMQVKIKISCD